MTRHQWILVLTLTTVITDYVGDNDLGKAVFMDEQKIANGEFILHCTGDDAIKDQIYWKKNGVRITGTIADEGAKYRNIHKVTNTDEALYECNGIELHLIRKHAPRQKAQTSVWKGTVVRCIDEVDQDEAFKLERTRGVYTTTVNAYKGYEAPIYPIKGYKISADSVFKCNSTASYTFGAETVPQTQLKYKDKKVICTNTDTQGRCILSIYEGDDLKVTGPSPELVYGYGKINIKNFNCNASCTVDGDVKFIHGMEIEINRVLYSIVIFIIILIIIILILIIMCVLWHKFGFKERYGYKIQMRLKKSFDVDNKFSSYRLSGVEADAQVDVESDDDPDETKEFRDLDEGSNIDDDSFVDPNFARTNQKQDMKSKDDIHSDGSNPRPFLRI